MKTNNATLLTTSLALFTALLLLSPQIGYCADGNETGNSSGASSAKKEVGHRQCTQKITPAYLSYMPFEVQSARAVTRDQIVFGLHETLRSGFEPAAAKRIGIVRLTSIADINTLRSLLRDRHNVSSMRPFGEPRLLLEAGNGEIQIFVCAGGLASQGTHQWQMSPQDFAKLKQILNRLYSETPQPK